MGVGVVDRYQGGLDGGLSRRRYHIGDWRTPDRRPSGSIITRSKSGSTTSKSTPASASSSRTIPRRQADCRHAAAFHGRTDPCRSRGDRQGVRQGLVEARSAGRAGTVGEGRIYQTRRRLDHAGRQALQRSRHGRRRPPPGDDPCRHHDRAAMEAGGHRCQDRCGAGYAARRGGPPAISTPS